MKLAVTRKYIDELINEHGDQSGQCIGGSATKTSLFGLVTINSVLLVNPDSIHILVLNRFTLNISNDELIKISDINFFKFKKGILQSKLKFKTNDGKKYNFYIVNKVMIMGNAQAELIEALQNIESRI